MKQLTLFIALLFTVNLNAQALKKKQLDYLSEHNIELIDSTTLYKNVLKENGKVKMLIIFTNYCVGTKYIFKNIVDYKEKYGDEIEFILCSSAPKRELDDLVKVLASHNYTDKVYFIDPSLYKEYRFDDRKKGYLFRNAICQACTEDEIGTPYRIFFSPDNEIIFYGFSSRKDFDEMLTKYFEGLH